MTKHVGPNWIPAETPWRVTHDMRGPSFPSGWETRVIATFSTLEEAIEECKKLLPAGCVSTSIHLALNPTTWSKNGGWKLVGSRKRKQDFTFSKAFLKSGLMPNGFVMPKKEK